MLVWRVSTLHLNTLQPLQNFHYFAKNCIAEENQLLGNVGEIWCDRTSDIEATGVTEVVTVIPYRETSGEWKNGPL
jgi:hypothetical protein